MPPLDDNTTVAEAEDAAPKATDTDAGAQAEPSLDDVLNSLESEFEQGTAEPQQEPKPDSEPAQNTALEERLKVLERERMEADISGAVSTIRDSGVNASPRVIRAMLNEIADEKPAFASAFANRKSNPEGWTKALNAASREINRELGERIDPGVTEDTEALAAAVRGTSSATTTDDEAPDFSKMSDAEFENWKRGGGR